MPRKKKSEVQLENELTEEMMYSISGGFDISRLMAKCPVAGCAFESTRMSELNVHMKQCHPELC